MLGVIEDCDTQQTERETDSARVERATRAKVKTPRRVVFGTPFCEGWPVLWPLAALLLVSAAFRWTDLDLSISSLFYDPIAKQWSWFYSPWCTLFYRRGVYPPFVLTIVAAIMIVWGGLTRHRNDLVRSGLFLLAVFVVGPGLIINTGFKPYWGRPRPHQVVQFGGTETFTPLGTPGQLQSNNSSFPSGHAAVAFYLMSPAFIVSGRRPRLSNGLFGAGLLFGTCMSLTRVIQGGHFASDVCWSAGVTYLTCVGMARLFLRPGIDQLPVAHESPGSKSDRAWNAAA